VFVSVSLDSGGVLSPMLQYVMIFYMI